MKPFLPIFVTSRRALAASTAGLVWLAALLLAGTGCRPATQESSETTPLAEDRELWNSCYIQGVKVGYERTTYRHVKHEGRSAIRIEGLVHLTIKRFQDVAESEMRFISVETPDGKVLEFEGHVRGSGIPMVTKGQVHGDRLEVKTVTHGKTVSAAHPWSSDCGGFFAVEQSLERQPMQPNERRKVRCLVAGTDQVTVVDLAARDFEAVKLLGGTYDLLRIDAALELPGGQKLTETMWTDRTGMALRRRTEAMSLESFRVPKAVALEKSDGAGFDLGKDLSVPLERTIPNAHGTKQVRYRLHLDGGDPAGTFVSGSSQRVRSLDPHTAEVTVYAIRPDSPAGNPDAADDPPTAEDSAPSSLIQSDNPKIVALAAEAAGQEEDPWTVAKSLEARTKATITKVDYTQALASAAEVVESGVGDCTEHAVLLAALARARGIPARVAIGLVYLEQDGKGTFAYHMWDELYLGKRWIPMDGTQAKGGIGAAHLKIAHTSLQGSSAFSSFLPVANVAGRLKVRVEQVE